MFVNMCIFSLIWKQLRLSRVQPQDEYPLIQIVRVTSQETSGVLIRQKSDYSMLASTNDK